MGEGGNKYREKKNQDKGKQVAKVGKNREMFLEEAKRTKSGINRRNNL